MNWFKSLPIPAVAVVIGAIIAIAWVSMEGTVPLVITIAGGAIIALRSVLESQD